MNQKAAMPKGPRPWTKVPPFATRHRSAMDETRYGDTFRLTVPGEAGQLRGVRREACGFAEHHRVQHLGDVALAVGEASSNVVLHAYADRPPGPLHLSGFVDDEADLVYLVVADEGSGLRPRSDSPGLGLGLPIIARTTAHVEITQRPESGTVLRMGFVHAPTHEAAEHEVFARARSGIAVAIGEGCGLDLIEQRIASLPLSAEARDALWLSAWADTSE